MSKYYLGVMSGTSADGVDIALADFTETPKLVAKSFHPFSPELHQKITSLYLPRDNEIDRLGQLAIELSHAYHQAISSFVSQYKIDMADIIAIGNHGQTIRHRPDFNTAFTMQIGCNHTLAALTNKRIIGDFRTKDVAYGGQGAPLVPAFHKAIFSNPTHDTFIINLGGIANITFIPKDATKEVLGFDTGPANALMDEWVQTHCAKSYDKDGNWASEGTINERLLATLIADPYFEKTAPKSTGREYFNLDWLKAKAQLENISPVDVQATLLALTASTVSKAIKDISSSGTIYLCGGGALNTTLCKALENHLTNFSFESLAAQEIDSNAFEAMAFAWLAYAFDKKIISNIPSVTGARKQVTLGVEFTP